MTALLFLLLLGDVYVLQQGYYVGILTAKDGSYIQIGLTPHHKSLFSNGDSLFAEGELGDTILVRWVNYYDRRTSRGPMTFYGIVKKPTGARTMPVSQWPFFAGLVLVLVLSLWKERRKALIFSVLYCVFYMITYGLWKQTNLDPQGYMMFRESIYGSHVEVVAAALGMTLVSFLVYKAVRLLKVYWAKVALVSSVVFLFGCYIGWEESRPKFLGVPPWRPDWINDSRYIIFEPWEIALSVFAGMVFYVGLAALLKARER